MPLLLRRVPLRISLTNLGKPRRTMWENWRAPKPFAFDPKHDWPLAVQQAFYDYRWQAERGHHEFNHAYEHAFRHSNRFTRKNKRWKDPVVDLGEVLAARQTALRKEFEAFRDRVWGQLAVKTAEDFGGNGIPRTVG